MNIKELQALRQEKVDAMENIVETRSESMTEEVLETLKTFKEEIAEIDNKIEAIEELRSVALKNSAPVEVKAQNIQEEISQEFRNYIVGKTNFRDFEQRASTLAGNAQNIVPEQFVRDLQEKINEYGALMPQVKSLNTADNGQVSIPVIDDTSNTAAWTDEGRNYSAADFSTGTITMDAYKITSGIQVSEELLQDSFFNIESYLTQAFATRLARTIEDAIINGDGVKKPEGILTHADTKTYTSENAGVVTSHDLLQAVFELQPSARKNAIIYVSDDLLKHLALEVDANGRPMLQTQGNSTVANKMKYTIGGYPVQVHYSLQDVDIGNAVAIIGDPKAYVLRRVQNFQVKRDEYTDMSTGMVNFYCSARLDGKVVNPNDSFVKVIVGGVK